jgi:hypothetical protein
MPGKSGQIRPSTIARATRGVGGRPLLASVLPEPEKYKYRRQAGSHLGNPGHIVASLARKSLPSASSSGSIREIPVEHYQLSHFSAYVMQQQSTGIAKHN